MELWVYFLDPFACAREMFMFGPFSIYLLVSCLLLRFGVAQCRARLRYVHVSYRSTQPCIPPGSLNRVPASAEVKAGMSPLPADPICHGSSVAVRRVANCCTPFTLRSSVALKYSNHPIPFCECWMYSFHRIFGLGTSRNLNLRYRVIMASAR